MSNVDKQKAHQYSIRDICADDIDVLIAMCREHALFENYLYENYLHENALYERSQYEDTGNANRLACALFAPVPRLHAWVAVACGELIGYATAASEFSTWSAQTFLHMDCLFVRDGWRNAGVGLALFNRVAAHARAMQINEIQWQTPDWNRDAARFYCRQGAIEILKRRFYLRTLGQRATEEVTARAGF